MVITFLDRLGLVAGHPLVYVAFIILVIVWLARLFLIKKNEPFDLVRDVPEKDRAKAIDTIITGVPEELCERRASLISKRYNIFAWLMTLVAVVVLGGLAAFYFTKTDSEIEQIMQERLANLENDISENQKSTQNGLDRLTTEFNKIFIQTIFKAPTNHTLTKDLIGFMHYLESLNLSGVVTTKSSQVHNNDGSFTHTKELISFEITENPSEDVDKALAMGLAKYPTISTLFSFFAQPRLIVGFNKSAPPTDRLPEWLLSHGKEGPQLLLNTHSSPTREGNVFRLSLDEQNQQIFISWNGFKYDKQRWVTSREITSITDVGDAWMGMIFTGHKHEIEDFVNELVPEWVNIKFDNNIATVTDFTATPAFIKAKAYTSTLPSEKQILSGKVNAKHALVHVGGF